MWISVWVCTDTVRVKVKEQIESCVLLIAAFSAVFFPSCLQLRNISLTDSCFLSICSSFTMQMMWTALLGVRVRWLFIFAIAFAVLSSGVVLSFLLFGLLDLLHELKSEKVWRILLSLFQLWVSASTLVLAVGAC